MRHIYTNVIYLIINHMKRITAIAAVIVLQVKHIDQQRKYDFKEKRKTLILVNVVSLSLMRLNNLFRSFLFSLYYLSYPNPNHYKNEAVYVC